MVLRGVGPFVEPDAREGGVVVVIWRLISPIRGRDRRFITKTGVKMDFGRERDELQPAVYVLLNFIGVQYSF